MPSVVAREPTTPEGSSAAAGTCRSDQTTRSGECIDDVLNCSTADNEQNVRLGPNDLSTGESHVYQ